MPLVHMQEDRGPGARCPGFVVADHLRVVVCRRLLQLLCAVPPAVGRWDSAEQLQQSPAYNYAQVIGYNEARTAGAGSAIFLHVDQGHSTSGCVSLPTSALLSVMRWERSGVVMAITR